MSLWVPSKKKALKKSLGTDSPEVARQLAIELALEKLALEKTGRNVFAGTLADLVNAWEKQQRARLERGELRSEQRLRQKLRVWRKQLAGCFGPLDKVKLSSLDQAAWDRYLHFCSETVKLSTVKEELNDFTALVRKFGLELGCPVVPDFKSVKVPNQERSRRDETLTTDEFYELSIQLRKYLNPDGDDGRYKREWSLRNYRRGAVGHFSQSAERLRRHQLLLFVWLLASSGLRHHELAGSQKASLRWGDLAASDVTAETRVNETGKVVPGLQRRAVF